MTTAATLDAEHAFVGCLLHLPAPVVADALAHVGDEDLAGDDLRQVLGIVRHLADAGVDPCPQAVLAHTRRHGPAAGADGIRVLALLLADLYDSAPVPAGWSYYRAAVVEEALRRRCAEMATRVGQCAEHDSMDTLLELLGTEMTAVRALHQRRRAVAS